MAKLQDMFSSGNYNTDKSENGYLPLYEELFHSMQNDPVKIFELGIFKGESLRLWRDYFPNGTIAGLDQHDVQIEGDRIRTYKGDQQDRSLLDHITKENAPNGWDIIIDDASHMAAPTKISFWHLFGSLKPGGIYVIEDWGTGYWSAWPDGETYHKCHYAGMVGLIKDLVDEVGIRDITHPKRGKLPHRESAIKELRIQPGMAVLVRSSDPIVPPSEKMEAKKVSLLQRIKFRLSSL